MIESASIVLGIVVNGAIVLFWVSKALQFTKRIIFMPKKKTKKSETQADKPEPAESKPVEAETEETALANTGNTSTGTEISENDDSKPVEEGEAETSKDTTDSDIGGREASGATDSESTPPKKSKKENLSPDIEQCPRCKHVSSDRAIKLGAPWSQFHPVIVNGKRYTTVTWQRIVCEQCRQHHIIKKFT
jgi:ssDNA-binding Zn-finger/Zn-ribbon topoisomerase 1